MRKKLNHRHFTAQKFGISKMSLFLNQIIILILQGRIKLISDRKKHFLHYKGFLYNINAVLVNLLF